MNSAVAGAAVMRERAVNPAATADSTAWLGTSARGVAWWPARSTQQPRNPADCKVNVVDTNGCNVSQRMAVEFTQRSILTTR